MATFTLRMTEEDGNPVAWIDRDGAVCIKQPHAPEQPEGSVWDSAESAEAWGNAHLAELIANEAAAIAAAEALAAAKASAQAKLAALGLTEEEISAIAK